MSVVNTQSNPRFNVSFFIELHNRGVSLPEISEVLDLLDGIRHGGCNVLTFVVLREPLEHALSDFKYFPRQYQRLDKNFTQFLREYVCKQWFFFA